jgi:hypothetical protein
MSVSRGEALKGAAKDDLKRKTQDSVENNTDILFSFDKICFRIEK